MKTRCAAPVLASLLLAASWAAAGEIAGLPLHVQKLGPGTIRLWLGDHISSTAVVAFATEKGIVVVDTFGVPSVDAELRREIARELGRSDFALLINTHEHADHTGGNPVYGDLPIVGHERIGPALVAAAGNRERLLAWYPRRIAELETELAKLPDGSPESRRLREDLILDRLLLGELEADRRPVPPTVTFSDRMTLDMGDTTFDLSFIGGMHSSSDVAVLVAERGLLLTGDTMADVWLTDTPGCLAAFTMRPGIHHDVPLWLANWDRLLARSGEIETLVPGHWNGELSLAGARARVEYVRTLWAGTRRVVEEGGGLPDLVAAYPLAERFPELAESPGFSQREHFGTLAEMWTVVSGQRSGARALYDLIAAGGDEAAVREILAERGKPASRYYFLEGELNRMGYAFLREGRAREAVRMLRLNAAIFPDSWNVYDSLGEALLAAGDTAGAAAMYERSLELNPESTSAREALARIRGEGPTT